MLPPPEEKLHGYTETDAYFAFSTRLIMFSTACSVWTHFNCTSGFLDYGTTNSSCTNAALTNLS